MAGVGWLPPRLLVVSPRTAILCSIPRAPIHALSTRPATLPPLTWTGRVGFSTNPPPADGKHDNDSASRLHPDEQHSRARELQAKRPWHREDADQPPAQKTGALPAKGKLLTTPNRLLKFTLPLPVGVRQEKEREAGDKDGDTDGQNQNPHTNIEPLSLFLHPQQPLSYVQRLIQAELPPVVDAKGRERPPNVYFWAEETGAEHAEGRRTDSAADASQARGSSHVAAYSGLGHEAAERHDADKDWVRWGSSTEMGDFIREAARGREFAIVIEGEPPATEIRVSVPSFADRTFYQRMRLRRLSRQIAHQAAIKQECDALAHRSARRLAKGGFGALVGWWAIVYYLTFMTEYGWDLVEPVTYLASLTLILGGYFWFLYISRDLSYKAAMNVTVSRQQTALYESRGFDVRRWERLVEEANGLRAEIRSAAYEYDVDWDEAQDLGGAKVKKVLEKEVKREKAKKEREEAEEAEAEEAEDEEMEAKDKEKK
ncbi:hypothetical protein SPBR_00544 [Sporothrix brasiliensis 5110]|uniref:Calcium uniporter protein n=1 Tax=Sporothrix brasiliensis 5110 TaxID=1398154 RepID=A0A0C2IYG2_9PEZI|nr:uncharacterized protein SPBR_00544 [Sporothrix brasiliensis 5110]KIH90037.1 hypothetical protein SPBR_00544 [Sporothrix brasiliensis 5110]